MHKSISVYIPTHNRPEMLDRALTSLLDQTYKNFQVLVCNDGSNKNYSNVINKFKDSFQDFVYIENEEAKGACNARNRLIDIADGEFITGLDDDDEFLPSRLDDFVSFPVIDSYSFLCAGHYTKSTKGIFKQKGHEGEIALTDLLSKNIVGNQVFVRTDYFRESKGFDERFQSWQDYDAWVNLVKLFGNGFKIPKYNYQLNIDHEESRISNSSKAVQGYEFFLEKYKDILMDEHLCSLYVQDKINRNDYIPTSWLMKHLSVDMIKTVSKYRLKKMFPGLKEWIYKK
ncbi:TPA: glycosyltransferase [Raoultella planticola]